MKKTLKDLEKLAESMGATIELDKFPDGGRSFVIVAPDNMQWKDGQCIHMQNTWHSHFPETRQEAIEDAIMRVSEGLEELDEELNP